jgi:hypothetical protein
MRKQLLFLTFILICSSCETGNNHNLVGKWRGEQWFYINNQTPSKTEYDIKFFKDGHAEYKQDGAEYTRDYIWVLKPEEEAIFMILDGNFDDKEHKYLISSNQYEIIVDDKDTYIWESIDTLNTIDTNITRIIREEWKLYRD